MDALLDSLPPFIHLKGAHGRPLPWFSDALRLLISESDRNLPGSKAIAERLAQIMFIRAVRLSMTSDAKPVDRPLAALTDPDIGAVMELIYAQPELPWTVSSMADRVCMSRSVFAARFRALVSKSPMKFVLECRMRKACALLAECRYSLKKISHLVGYGTEASFSRAFKRWSGASPRQLRYATPKNAECRRRVTGSQAPERGGNVPPGFEPSAPVERHAS